MRALLLPFFFVLCSFFNLHVDAVAPAQPELNSTNTSNRYIVVFKPNITEQAIRSHIERVQTLRFTSNATVHLSAAAQQPPLSYSAIGQFHWYSGEFYSEAFESLFASSSSAHQNDDEEEPVAYWIKDLTLSLQEMIQMNPPSWGLDRIDQRKGTNNQYRFASAQGQGVDIYLLDTGVNGDHTDLKDRVRYGPNVIDPTDNSQADVNGHGTFVAGVCCGTNYGVAKMANVVSVKTLDDQGNGLLSDLLTGLEWVVQQHTAKNNSKSIVNLSLGAMYSQAANDAIEEAIKLGVHVTIAAGNYGDDACKYSPGSAPNAVTVGAIDQDDSIAYYSNFGKCVDVFAPGTNIVSIWNTGTDATHVLTGTSMAAPHVAGAMALFLSQQDYTPYQLADHIKQISSLISEDFQINNTIGNPNKTVLDNAVTDGYHVKGYPAGTPANVLFTHPDDGQTLWVFGQVTNHAASAPSSSSSSSCLFYCMGLLLLLL